MLAKIPSVALLFAASLGCRAALPAERGPARAVPSAIVVSFAPINHWHVFAPKKLSLSVADAHGTGIAGLDILVQITSAHGAPVERASRKNLVHDEGGGHYSVEFAPSEIGAHAIAARVAYAGREFVSTPLVFEVARDGDEGIRVDAAGTSFVYQIRYAWVPGEIHASDSNKVKLVFEIMRGVPRGGEIEWKQPWRNRFDHVDAAREPTVFLESEGIREQLSATYKGLGIYEAERAFPTAEVGAKGREYRVRLTFIDPMHGTQVTHADSYRLRALP